MSTPAWQQNVADFVTRHRLDAPVEVRLLDLLSEIGELAKVHLKSTHYGQVPFEPNPDWTDELGDAFFSLICVANSSHVNLETALARALDKLASRLNRTGQAGSGS